MSTTLLDRPGSPARQRISQFVGTLGLLRLYLRRDRVVLPLWVLLLSIPLASVYIGSIDKVYPTAADRAAFAASVMASPAQRALYGPIYNDGLGAVGIWKAGMFHLLIAVAVVLTVIRHTRADEETGRAELLDSTAVGRYASLSAVLLLSFGASVATGVIGAAGLLTTEVAPSGSLAFGAALAGSGLVFTALAAVAAQLSASARVCRGYAFAALGAAFTLRAVGDAGSGALSWFSPLGWSLQVRPYADERWWVLLLHLATTAVLTAVAYRLLAARDVGAGLIAERRRGEHHRGSGSTGGIHRPLRPGATPDVRRQPDPDAGFAVGARLLLGPGPLRSVVSGAGAANTRRGAGAGSRSARLPRLPATRAIPFGPQHLVVAALKVSGVNRNSAPALDRPWRRPNALGYARDRIAGVVRPRIAITEAPAEVIVDRDVEVPTRDGTLLRINVFRRSGESPRPVMLSIHPYGKDELPRRKRKRWTFSRQYRMIRQPSRVQFSSLTGWEAPDPAFWTAQGFVVVNADARGCGRSDGTGNLLSRQEAEDTYDLVQWLAGQPWSDGNVVMLGVSYLAITQYAVAALRPPALRAICPWEGFTDAYRDLTFPGGIRETGFTALWSRNLARSTRQAYVLTEEQDRHPLRDDFWRSIAPDLAAIDIPMLVCGSFSDNNLHSRGSIRAFTRTGSEHARLYTHRGGKWAVFYSPDAQAEQLKFFRDVLDGARASRSVRLEVREDRDTVVSVREEGHWPLVRTRWQPMYLAGGGVLTAEPPRHAGSITFETSSRAAAFNWTVAEDIELTGSMAAKLWVQLDGCDDANLFVGVEKWRDGRYVGFEGSYGYGRDRVTTGWQRVALRALDPELSQPWEPVPACAEPAAVSPGEVTEVQVALGPSATLFRAGEQLRFVVAGRWLSPRNPLTGQFPAAYSDPPRGQVTLRWGPRYDAHLLIPVIPQRTS
ncbi:CocE/NonD family hydrolase [Mycobacterium kiyosense]|uniref:Xaa-Pro dipeptidyl-peptidase C-terminal domain-containing protein n=1 Tax=Mycobacterium kiyosense TaxID=2871094 RepID=A0A9P3Q5N0_9MYCO|nr:hypothetical protein MKCMC460_47750 [Mycobacterium sp. 20KCMC460]GLB81748.1 hypothetical protein SRL2020028_10040 [Mycobacterium kiyosense]GLB90388.1 hypothetical protein SRL2020130_32050 [Mycobacterium kiyosense]GLB96023.1 hypothetical protein SRL2020226_27990 [Mycobacterium kiyosense]GLC02155.1 hypothetical protein SRL2020400_27460 [Mycobacterium kiyosense]